jgi:ABC-type multidrug transport system fused ATPase/permease subunit
VPDGGTIVIGGIELADWDVGALRENVGFMPQETMLLHGTLAENVAFGRPGASRDEIRRALEAAGGGPLTKRLRRGLDTLIGERGQGLSGGERQVVGLARLFLRDPRIVLLDEPTSQLDGESLRVVNAALSSLVQGRTTLLITHTHETLRLASRLILVDRGRVVAQGTHADLLTGQPLYGRLVGNTNGRQSITGEPVGSAALRRGDV